VSIWVYTSLFTPLARQFYLVAFSILMVYRFTSYMEQNYQLYLLDFCYLCIHTHLYYHSLYPESEYFQRVAFFLGSGYALFGVPIWNNSLVLHSVDKLTSTFLHLSPAMVFIGTNACEVNNTMSGSGCDPIPWLFLNALAALHSTFLMIVTYVFWVMDSRPISERNDCSYSSMRKIIGVVILPIEEKFGVVFGLLVHFGVFSLIYVNLATLVVKVAMSTPFSYRLIVALNWLCAVVSACRYYRRFGLTERKS